MKYFQSLLCWLGFHDYTVIRRTINGYPTYMAVDRLRCKVCRKRDYTYYHKNDIEEEDEEMRADITETEKVEAFAVVILIYISAYPIIAIILWVFFIA